MNQNTFRLSVQLVGFGARRHEQYKVHINCPCKLVKSLYGTYATEQECREAVPVSRPAHTCTKSTPIIPEPVKETVLAAKPQRKVSPRAAFTRDTARVIREADENGSTFHNSGDYILRVDRENGAYKALVVVNSVGDFFEFRCPFSAQNAGEIAAQVWNLMQTMGL